MVLQVRTQENLDGLQRTGGDIDISLITMPVSKRKQAQQKRREREMNEKNQMEHICNANEGISKRSESQRKRREREKEISALNNSSVTKKQRQRKCDELSESTSNNLTTTRNNSQTNEDCSNKNSTQRRCPIKEPAAKKQRQIRDDCAEKTNEEVTTSDEPVLSNVPRQNKRSLAQSARRKSERSKQCEFSYTMDGIMNENSQPLQAGEYQRGKGKQPIIENDDVDELIVEDDEEDEDDEITYYLYGSSSTGDSTRENQVMKRYPIKERTNMEGNDCTTVVHPVSDSHYDTILEDEIHIPIDPVENVPKERHYLGKMDVICPSCSAYHWLDERLTKSTKKKSFFGMCCLQGKIKLPLLTPLPSAIKLLYEGRNSLARSFRKDIRSYNAANAFSSLGVSMDKRILKGRGPTSFTIHGQLSHQIGSLLPESDKSPSYSQLYIYDPHIALDCRQKRNLHLNPAIMKIMQNRML